jgi:hypothetical protein
VKSPHKKLRPDIMDVHDDFSPEEFRNNCRKNEKVRWSGNMKERISFSDRIYREIDKKLAEKQAETKKIEDRRRFTGRPRLHVENPDSVVGGRIMNIARFPDTENIHQESCLG